MREYAVHISVTSLEELLALSRVLAAVELFSVSSAEFTPEEEGFNLSFHYNDINVAEKEKMEKLLVVAGLSYKN